MAKVTRSARVPAEMSSSHTERARGTIIYTVFCVHGVCGVMMPQAPLHCSYHAIPVPMPVKQQQPKGINWRTKSAKQHLLESWWVVYVFCCVTSVQALKCYDDDDDDDDVNDGVW